jgi:hypothetical protein
MILSISASQVARITGMSHLYVFLFLNQFSKPLLGLWHHVVTEETHLIKLLCLNIFYQLSRKDSKMLYMHLTPPHPHPKVLT